MLKPIGWIKVEQVISNICLVIKKPSKWPCEVVGHVMGNAFMGTKIFALHYCSRLLNYVLRLSMCVRPP